MQQPTNLLERIRSRLNDVVDGMAELIKALPVRRIERNSGGVLFVGPEYWWGDLSPEQRATQLTLKRRYEPLAELHALLLRDAPKDLARQRGDADKHFRVWLELGSNWSIKPDAATNEKALKSATSELERTLSVLALTGSAEKILVPDTNSLLAEANPAKYRNLGGRSFVFMLLPTVLGELDKLKIGHRNPDVCEKAKKVITRIKGWRNQGSLVEGVTVDKSITVMAAPSEPDMGRTLSWLDATNQDDRIIASVLSLQVQRPAARIVLVTGDINLLNKADVAFVETADIP